MTLTQPRITWSKASGANGWRKSSGPAALHGEIDRRERARLAARLDERRAAAVDDVDRAVPYSAASDVVPGGGRAGTSSGPAIPLAAGPRSNGASAEMSL